MGRRFTHMLFPEGKKKTLTLSYDDGVIQDRKLIKILNQYGLKGTFNLNSAFVGLIERARFPNYEVDITRLNQEDVKEVYTGHEVGGHSLWHSSLPDIGTSPALYEIIEDRNSLEKMTGKFVQSFAYPGGFYNLNVKELLRLSGYNSARTVISTENYALPDDFLQWNATCHHNNPRLMELVKDFCERKSIFREPLLFYLWGHSYEFDGDKNWGVIENFAEYVSSYAKDIWFATNGEIVEYVTAYRSLIYSADGSMIKNPTGTIVWININHTEYKIDSGETILITE